MSRLTRDGTAESVSRDQILGDRGILIFPVQLTTSRIGNLTRLIHTLLYVMIIHTYIHTYIHTRDAAAELGSNPVSKDQIQPEYVDEPADAGRDCRTRLARPISQARTRTYYAYMYVYVSRYVGL